MLWPLELGLTSSTLPGRSFTKSAFCCHCREGAAPAQAPGCSWEEILVWLRAEGVLGNPWALSGFGDFSPPRQSLGQLLAGEQPPQLPPGNCTGAFVC